jgi:hypothetical protein
MTNGNGTFSRTLETDQKGDFRFIDIPPGQHYTLAIEYKDTDLIPKRDPILKGTVKLSGHVQKGVKINNTLTDGEGRFRVGKGTTQENKYTTMPANIPSLDRLYFTNPELYQEIMQRYGAKEADQLVFKVQIAALKNPKDFDHAPFAGLGEVERMQENENLTLFLIGNFSTLSQAEDMKDKIIQRDVGDAFTVIFHNGERKYLKDVFAENLFHD